jgi:hypothetical protein
MQQGQEYAGSNGSAFTSGNVYNNDSQPQQRGRVSLLVILRKSPGPNDQVEAVIEEEEVEIGTDQLSDQAITSVHLLHFN